MLILRDPSPLRQIDIFVKKIIMPTSRGKIKDLITRADIKYLTSESHNMIPEWFKK